ncbi:MAG TPA: M20/M25/M40 family metallo-hydrolase [Gemmatimonadaceae bacterium]|nr:M20/M25/M40 family metallo-hydrolase [Gemmatimonadaceae bacterium]
MRRMTALISLFAVGGALHAQAPAPPSGQPARAATASARTVIPQDELRKDLTIFASDSMRGRDASSPDSRRAADFLARRLAALGVEPAGDSGKFLQAVPLARTGIARAHFTVTDSRGSTDIPFGTLAPLPSFGPSAPLPRLVADGDLVFAGYGIAAPELGRDDVAALGDLSGKIAVVVQGAPANADSVQRSQMLGEQSFAVRVRNVLQKNPAAVIVLFADGPMLEQFPLLVSEIKGGITTMGPAPQTVERPRELPMVVLGSVAGASALLPSGWPADDKPQPLTGRRFRANVQMAPPTVYTYNVVGVIRGSDRALANNYVALGAHLDHLGLQTPENGDSIANGADDDGSGSIALLSIARALKQGPQKPKRSVLLVWHTAEELGLFGSQWFTTHPTVPLDSVVAQINADMIGRNAPDSLYIVGPAAAPNGASQALGAIVDTVNAGLPKPFLFNREWDSPSHPEQIYYRSDHYNYARRGIPVVFLTSGLHADYHKVSDEIDKIDFDKLTRVTELLYRTALAVANAPTSPRPPAATP